MKNILSYGVAAIIAASALMPTVAGAATAHALDSHIFRRAPATRVWTDHWQGRTRINMCANGNQLVGMVLDSAGVVYPPPAGVTYNIVTDCRVHKHHK